MRKIICVFYLGIFSLTNLLSQQSPDLGLFVGMSSYMGDLNPANPFYQPSVAYGGLFRINIQKRYALQINGYYTPLKGTDINNEYFQFGSTQANTFNTSLIDITSQFQINFLPFVPTKKTGDYNSKMPEFTPYIASGIGLMMKTSSTTVSSDSRLLNFVIPISAGIKMNLGRRSTAGIEWSFRKTFADDIDGATLQSPEKSSVHNNDWYSYLGLNLTIKIFNSYNDCPAYNN